MLLLFVTAMNVGINAWLILNACFSAIVAMTIQLDTIAYSRSQLLRFRPRVLNTKPENSLLSVLKRNGLLRYRGIRSGSHTKAESSINRHCHIPTWITVRPTQVHDCKLNNRRYACPTLTNVTIKRDFLGSCKKFARFGLINARSVKNKVDSIVEHVLSSKVDCCAFTETWIRQDDSVSQAAMSSHGLKFDFHARTSRQTGGGTGLLYMSHIQVKKKEAGEKQSYEYSRWNVIIVNDTFCVFVIYRPPYSHEHPVGFGIFLQELSDHLEQILIADQKLLIVGDFNVHFENENSRETSQLKVLLDSLGLIQHVRKPTHISGHMLDLVITRACDELDIGEPVCDTLISDHYMLQFMVRVPKPDVHQEIVRFRKLKDIDMVQFKQKIAQELNVTGLHPEEAAQQYDSVLSRVLDDFALVGGGGKAVGR